MGKIIAEQLTLFAEDSPVKISQPPEKGQDWKGKGPVSGSKCSGSSEEPDPLFASLKMFLLSEFGARTECSLTWKNQGTPLGLSWWALSMPEPPIGGNALGLWPTPKASPSGPDYARMNRLGSGGDDLATAVARMMFPSPAARDWRSGKGRKDNGHTPQLPEVIGGQLNPPWVEFLMGFPIGHTELKPSETP